MFGGGGGATAAASDDAADVHAPDDLASLPNLNDEAVLEGVKLRFQQNKIYTRINNLLIAMNPYQILDDLYTKEQRAAYKAAPVGSIAPHVYGTSAAAYNGLLANHSQVNDHARMRHASPAGRLHAHAR